MAAVITHTPVHQSAQACRGPPAMLPNYLHSDAYYCRRMQETHRLSDQLGGFIRLLRWPNLLMIAGLQLLADRTTCTNSSLEITLLILMTLFATAGGYLINDIYDLPSDRINTPYRPLVTGTVSVTAARRGYLVLSLGGFGCAILLSNTHDGLMLWVFGGIALSLWLYSRWLKGIAVIGNLVVSFLCALAVCLPCLLMMGWNPLPVHIVILAVFAFLLTWIREIVKDMEDTEGDKEAGYHTLPILAGQRVSAGFAFLIILITAAGLCLPILRPGSDQVIRWILWLCTAGCLVFCAILLVRAQSSRDFRRISGLLKFSMITGACLVFL